MIGVALLLALVLVDGAFSGFRSSVGRTGLVRHGADDRTGAARGLLLVSLLVLPAAVVTAATASDDTAREAFARAATAIVVILLPYAAVVLLALAAYALLGWRQKYLASAMILGPFTLVRPLVAVAAAGWGVLQGGSVDVGVAAVLGTSAVLAVEPLAGRLWYGPSAGSDPSRGGRSPGLNSHAPRVSS